MKRITPPRHLSASAKKLWREICATHVIADANQAALLRAACESFDRCEAARKLLDAQGITVKDRFGQLRAHPACAVERDSRASMVACFRALGLSDPDPLDIG